MAVTTMTNDWQLPEVEATGKAAVVRTGPSGLVLGRTNRAEVALRLFRPQGSRVFMAAPDYAVWLLVFRAFCLGAHITVIADDHRNWRSLAQTIQRCGGTIDLLGRQDRIPGQGRPYRPSLVVDDSAGFDASQVAVGAWQTIAVLADISAGSAVHSLRNCDLALLGPVDQRGLDNVRRAYVLSQAQLRQASNLGQSDVVLAMPRRMTRVSMPPSATEYRLLFNG
ncbi:hypothetical protein ACQB6R_00915 [Propionibacteriaceae bacterium G1746]|uniref:hypothetical protein n=1 Tax=Aestuariimicrobium sp. G57 TaxID=3418485 RepID=UPI003C1D5D09